MTDSVLLLGAGFSRDAGIPLLDGMVKCILDFAANRPSTRAKLSAEDVEIFTKADTIRKTIDTFHGRVNFDDQNIEDLLSILSFNLLRGKDSERENLEALTRAVARAIELTCSVLHPGVGASTVVHEGPTQYRELWKCLLARAKMGYALPTIITLNYDLVVERALLQILNSTKYFDAHPGHLPFQTFVVNYHTPFAPARPLKIVQQIYDTTSGVREYGLRVIDAAPEIAPDGTIDILKLHGSLNFSLAAPAAPKDFNMAASLNDPLIPPPISNKLTSANLESVWAVAMKRLEKCRSIAIVGYSLPKTDMYMQYFLKAAIGPNTNLQRITVFDPELHRDGNAGREIRTRYADCFSNQIQKRINFTPIREKSRAKPGTTEAFIDMLQTEPLQLFD